MYDGKDAELEKRGYESYSVRKLRQNQKLQSDYSIIKFAESEGMILITEDGEINNACIENKIPCIRLGQNPSADEIEEKVNVLKPIKQTPFWKRLVVGGITVILAIAFAWLAYQYGPSFTNLSYGYREFIIAVAGSGAGIGIMFLKKAIRESAGKKLMESMELLMFFITPAALSFPLLPNGEYKIVWIMVIYFIVSSVWLIVSLLLVNRGAISGLTTKRATYVLGSIYYLWSYLIAIGLLIVYLFLVIHPIS